MSSSQRRYRSGVPDGRTISIGIQFEPKWVQRRFPLDTSQNERTPTSSVDPLVVDLEEETGSFLPFQRSLDQFNSPKPNGLGNSINHRSILFGSTSTLILYDSQSRLANTAKSRITHRSD